jgi:hydroxyacylglutathione hydrolase
MLKVYTIPVTVFEQNARILQCSETNAAVVIDPGGESARICEQCRKNQIEPEAIWLTHSHLDHCGGVRDVKKAFGCKLLAHPVERVMREKTEDIAKMYGISAGEFHNCPEPEVEIRGGEALKLGSCVAKVLFTPGHSPGHVCFYFETEKILIGGDTVFAGSIGRTDLPGGDTQTLLDSIRKEILALPDEVRILSGHGPDTSVGRERRTNPFLN